MPELIPVRTIILADLPEQTCNARDLHGILGVGKDFSNWIKAQIERARLVDGRDFVTAEVLAQKGGNPGGRPRIDYHLTIDAAKHVAMMSGTDKGYQVREYFLECERRAKAQPAPAIPQTLPEALRLAADLAEQKAVAEAERDEAVRTKALIGSRREATAMATAAAARRQVRRLQIELDCSTQYATVKRMEMLYPSQKFNWRLLKRIAAELGLKPVDVPDANYGEVKAYHADVWREAYALEIPASAVLEGADETALALQ